MAIPIFAILGVLALTLILGYNSLVGKRNQTDNAFSAIDAMLKKRFDLIPNLVATVKNYTQYEQTTLNQIVELRSKALNGGLNPNETVDLDNQMSQAIRQLVVVSESYPELKASENYNQLQRALNETEEQLAAARRNYNASVTTYNDAVQMFPTNFITIFFKFPTRPLLMTPESEKQNIDINHLFKA